MLLHETFDVAPLGTIEGNQNVNSASGTRFYAMNVDAPRSLRLVVDLVGATGAVSWEMTVTGRSADNTVISETLTLSAGAGATSISAETTRAFLFLTSVAWVRTGTPPTSATLAVNTGSRFGLAAKLRNAAASDIKKVSRDSADYTAWSVVAGTEALGPSQGGPCVQVTVTSTGHFEFTYDAGLPESELVHRHAPGDPAWAQHIGGRA